MTLVTSVENADTPNTDVHLTLTRPDAERLHQMLPGLLRALADRPTATPRQREWRRRVSTILEHLQVDLASQVQSAKPAPDTE
jgi:hypothetical protein